jgi:hypothetical protein
MPVTNFNVIPDASLFSAAGGKRRCDPESSFSQGKHRFRGSAHWIPDKFAFAAQKQIFRDDDLV